MLLVSLDSISMHKCSPRSSLFFPATNSFSDSGFTATSSRWLRGVGDGIATQWFWREQFGTMGPHIPLGAAKSLPTTRWFEVVASPIIGIIAKLDQEQ